jgi:hypothetical protein
MTQQRQQRRRRFSAISLATACTFLAWLIVSRTPVDVPAAALDAIAVIGGAR